VSRNSIYTPYRPIRMTMNPTEVPSHFIERTMVEIQTLKELKRIQSECRETCRRAGDMHTVDSYDKSIDELDEEIAIHNELIMTAKQIIQVMEESKKLREQQDNNPGQ